MWGVSLFCTKGVFVSIYIWIPFLGLFVDTEKFFLKKKNYQVVQIMDIFLLPGCIIENKDLVLIIVCVCVWIASLLFTLEEKALKKTFYFSSLLFGYFLILYSTHN
jgi:hypothetical protein